MIFQNGKMFINISEYGQHPVKTIEAYSIGV